jgi:replication factor A2
MCLELASRITHNTHTYYTHTHTSKKIPLALSNSNSLKFQNLVERESKEQIQTYLSLRNKKNTNMSFYADSNTSTNNQGGGFFSPGGSHTADGGYAGTPDAFGSQQKKGGKSRYNDKLIPVTVSMILRSESDMNEDTLFRYKSVQEFSQVKLVGFVTAVKETSTHVLFTVADGTGRIDVKMWTDSNEDSDNTTASFAREKCSEGTYIRIVGTIKLFNDKKEIQAFNILPVTDFNEITHHALETTYVHLKVTKGTSSGVAAGSDDISTKTYDGVSSNADGDKLTDDVKEVFMAHSSDGENGLDIKRAVEMLVSKGYVAQEVRKAIGFLTDEGHLYSTIDENHLKCT